MSPALFELRPRLHIAAHRSCVRVQDGIPARDRQVDLVQRARRAVHRAVDRACERKIDAAARRYRSSLRAQIQIAVDRLSARANGDADAGQAGARRDHHRRRARLAVQEVDPADSVLHAPGGERRVNLVYVKCKFVVLIADDGRGAGCQLSLGRFQPGIQATAKGRIHIGLDARQNGRLFGQHQPFRRELHARHLGACSHGFLRC
ncbi:hypothetical protein D3C86_1530600 [compost metagenome]